VAASFGALTLLTGCDVSDSASAEQLLAQVSKFNDAVQAFIFNPDALAPTFPESAITKPFPFNGYYEVDEAPEIDGKDWKFEVRGLVDNKKSWTLEELYKLAAGQAGHAPYLRRGLERIGSWTGTPLRDFLKLVGRRYQREICWFQCRRQGWLQLTARYAYRRCIRRPRWTFKFGDEILPRAYGYPMKIRGADQARVQESEYVISMEVTNDYKGGYWEDQGYNSIQRQLRLLMVRRRSCAVSKP